MSGGGGGCCCGSWRSGTAWQRSVSTVHGEGKVADQELGVEERVHPAAHVEGGIVGTVPVTLTVVQVRVDSVTGESGDDLLLSISGLFQSSYL